MRRTNDSKLKIYIETSALFCDLFSVENERESGNGKREKKNFVDLHLSLNNKWPKWQNGKVATGMWHVACARWWHVARSMRHGTQNHKMCRFNFYTGPAYLLN